MQWWTVVHNFRIQANRMLKMVHEIVIHWIASNNNKHEMTGARDFIYLSNPSVYLKHTIVSNFTWSNRVYSEKLKTIRWMKMKRIWNNKFCQKALEISWHEFKLKFTEPLNWNNIFRNKSISISFHSILHDLWRCNCIIAILCNVD